MAEARRKDAEALRSRFTACDTGLTFARTLRDVAVRDVIIKNSVRSVAGAARDPRQDRDRTSDRSRDDAQGIELFALCEKKETTEDTPEKREARDKMFAEKFQPRPSAFFRIAQPGDDRTQVGIWPRPLALTLGEPAGIGPDLTIALWRRRRELDLPPFYIIAAAISWRSARSRLGAPSRSRHASRERRRDLRRGTTGGRSRRAGTACPAGPTLQARRPPSRRSISLACATCWPAMPTPS